jgi:hypothetical protein
LRKRTTHLVITTLILSTLLMTIAVAYAKPLYGSMALYKPPIGPTHPAGPLSWSGTITGDINGNMYFYKTAGLEIGNTKHFWEVWLITDENDNMLLTGTDKGVVTIANWKYRMNGEVTDAAPEYAHLIGHQVHMSGIIIHHSATEKEAPGTFRVN